MGALSHAYARTHETQAGLDSVAGSCAYLPDIRIRNWQGPLYPRASRQNAHRKPEVGTDQELGLLQ